MSKTNNQNSVKSNIIDAAWKLFHEKGYDQTTVDDIIALSKTSKGSFYYYFSTKDELLSTLSELLDSYYQKLGETMDPEQNSFDKLIYLNAKVHEMMENKIDINLITSLYSTQLIAKGNRHLLDQNRIYYRMISDIVEEGQKRGQIVQDKSISAITNYYALCERALVSDWCLGKGSYSLAEYSKEYMPIMMEHFKLGKM